MAADIFSGALIILRGLSSSKTNFNARSNGGTYLFVFSKDEKRSFLFSSIIWISSTPLINLWVFKKRKYSFSLLFKKLAPLFISKAIKTISDWILSLTSST